MSRDIYTEMLDTWGSPRVRRSDVTKFSFGILSGKTLANLTAAGENVPPSEQIGRYCVYRAADLAEWLRNKYGGRAA